MFAIIKSSIRILAIGTCLVFMMGCSPSKTSSDTDSRPEASLEEVNQALATWYTAKASYPSNLTELETAPFLKKRLPTPPPGEKLVLGSDGRAVFVSE